MSRFRITPSTNRKSAGETWEHVTDSVLDTLVQAECNAPDNVPDLTMMYGLEVLQGQLERMRVGDALTECWSMAVFEARIERIA